METTVTAFRTGRNCERLIILARVAETRTVAHIRHASVQQNDLQMNLTASETGVEKGAAGLRSPYPTSLGAGTQHRSGQ
ncbi:hypothetical protein BDQ17DRAFT_736141 [Cyathus striatus]|nr:hypothetical protein BDQ17DRAFT_736141 [Cyathus striatus]